MQQNTQKNKIVFVFILLIIILIIGIFLTKLNNQPVTVGGQKDQNGCLIGAGYSWCDARKECERSWERYCTSAEPKQVSFSCSENKIIDATFYPTDDKYVDLILDDERSLSVPRAMSGSGARYANSDESFVFWNKGDTAFITENGTTTFENCQLR